MKRLKLHLKQLWSDYSHKTLRGLNYFCIHIHMEYICICICIYNVVFTKVQLLRSEKKEQNKTFWKKYVHKKPKLGFGLDQYTSHTD